MSKKQPPLFPPLDSTNTKDSDSDGDDEDFDQMMEKVKSKVNKRNHFEFANCIHRNIVLIGRSRTGKTTVGKVIEDPYYVPEIAKLYGETRTITFNHIAAPIAHGKAVYYLNLIDTPGLYDKVTNTGEYLTNDTIQQIIYQCIQRDATHINTFGFVFSSASGINPEDIDSMLLMKKNFSEMSGHFFLLLTHCEEKSDDECEEYINEFFQHPRVIESGLKEFFKLGVLFMGSLRPPLRRTPNFKSAASQGKRVLSMRHKLLEFIINHEESFNIHYVAPPTSATPEAQQQNQSNQQQHPGKNQSPKSSSSSPGACRAS